MSHTSYSLKTGKTIKNKTTNSSKVNHVMSTNSIPSIIKQRLVCFIYSTFHPIFSLLLLLLLLLLLDTARGARGIKIIIAEK